MHVNQYHFQNGEWSQELPIKDNSQLLLSFGDRALAQGDNISQALHNAFPNAHNIGCSTSGEIAGTDVYDESLVVTAIEFEQTQIQVESNNISHYSDSFEAGIALAKRLSVTKLKYVLVICDGALINGTKLVAGINQSLPPDVLVTGGMAGDGERFEKTVVWHNERAESGLITLCGLYGEALSVGHGTLAGWTPFGPQRRITRAKGNVLYELDNQPALDLYKRYLGDFADQLPASALRFPLNLQLPGETDSVVRTILSINEEEKSMTFAGDMPENAIAKLMKSTFDALIDGAGDAAIKASQALNTDTLQLTLLVSCVGRRLVLGQRIYEELEAVKDALNSESPFCGFYSYGEISPLVGKTTCRLHNQTMAITTFSENA